MQSDPNMKGFELELAALNERSRRERQKEDRLTPIQVIISAGKESGLAGI